MKFEIKYITTMKKGINFINALSAHVDYDKHAPPDKRYQVRSLYYDTAHLAHYHEKVYGHKVRKKFRLRCYGPDSEKVFFEVKHKYDRIITKDRSYVPLSEAKAIFESPFENNSGSPSSRYAFELARHPHYPMITIVYERVALEEPLSKQVRVTLDFNIRCGKPDMFLRQVTAEDYRILPPGTAIIEIKFVGKLPSWLYKNISVFELTPTSYSKYCKGVDRLYNKKTII